MLDTPATTILLAKALVTRDYEASFGSGQSRLASLEEFAYNPVKEEFLVRDKDDVLMGSWITKRFPCSRAQAVTILRRVSVIDPHGNLYLRFDHRGYLCLMELEKNRRGLALRFNYYTGLLPKEIRLSAPLTSALLKAAVQTNWLGSLEK